MRTLAILLLATVNLALLVSVSIPLFRHEAYVPVIVAAHSESAAQDKAAVAAIIPAAAVPAVTGNSPEAVHSAAAATHASESTAPADNSTFLYVKASGLPQGARVERDSKSVADLKDVKDVEPIAELLPPGERVLSDPGVPNSEFVTSTVTSVTSGQSSSNNAGESSGTKSLGILRPAQVINTVPPTVSEESPL